MLMRRLPAAALIFACVVSASRGLRADDKVDFNREIRPILSDVCFKCHGPDEKERQAGLRFDLRDVALTKLESGAAAIVPGDIHTSELVKRITSADEAKKMPPMGSGRKLTAKQTELLTRWVAEGAEYRGHWSFIPAQRPPLPAPQQASFVKNPIDAYVAARLEKAGLTVSPEADKITLIRRLTFDLTGLPPTLAELDAFVADTSGDAYNKVVDRLLQSPRFGEHMARYWLDLARYGDTHGLHLDNERAMWKYREWVINAFNQNMPFDQFTVEQLAGDLIPNATMDQKIASGFNRCNVTTGEGGSIDEEVRVRYAVDRTEALGTVFMGLTLGCAVCHDHKFDPITQKEFYQLLAYYNSTQDAAMDGNALAPPPLLKVSTPEIDTKLQAMNAASEAVRTRLKTELAAVQYVEPATAPTENLTAPQEFVWVEDAAPEGAKLEGKWEFVAKPDHPVFQGAKSTRQEGAGMVQHFFTGAKSPLKVGEKDLLFAYVYLDPANPPETVMLQFNDGGWEHRAYWGKDTIAFGTGDVPGHRLLGPLPKTGEWVRLEVNAQHVGINANALINGFAFTQFGGLCYWDHGGILTQTPQDGAGFDSQLKWEAYEKSLAKSTLPQPVTDAIKVEADKRTDVQKAVIRDHFLQFICTTTRDRFAPINQELEALKKQTADLDGSIPLTLVMGDMPTERETFVLVRGAYDKHGDKVPRGVPQVLPPLPADAPANRLGLAKWLVDRQHPLTARVAVNRLWQNFFGRGIVKTSEDFGSQGQWPSNPELIDWLAVDFVESGWNVKQLLKQIVESSTYRQSSQLRPGLLDADPENALVSRGPRFRMDAEVVRDNCLALSGLLVERSGGKSVKTYQPAGLWEAVAFTSSNTSAFKRDSGEALYRRSMYTFWKRTCPPAGLSTFDAPSRENCTARRARTNTPLQALALMNDEQFVECSRQFGQRMIKEGGATPTERLTFGFRLMTGRAPQQRELAVLTKQLDQHLTHYQAHAEEAVKLISIGDSKRDETLPTPELATYTMVANLLFNLDEAITKE